MPIYEFLCMDCNRIFSFFSRSFKEERIPKCPKCNGMNMTKQISLVARHISKSRKASGGDSTSPDMDRPYDPGEEAKMEKAMKILEKEMAGINEENPDPRQLGRLMRRMSEITGEPMPEEMNEAVRRLEAGEDPEKIEEEMGDMFGDGESAQGGGYGGPIRDPGLYDF